MISNSCLLSNINIINDQDLTNLKAKFRYRQEETNVEIEFINNNEILVKYPIGVKSVTPGQACVFYKNDECIGGGIIKEVRKDEKKLWYLL